jgi:uncharacterized membrane protein YedE/YeeE
LASTTHAVSTPAAAAHERAFEPRPYANPYLAGMGLGLVLLAAFVFMGRGLGASGAFNSTIAWLVSLDVPGHPLKAWLVFEVLGVFAGAVLSGVLAKRMSRTVEKGPRASVALRLGLAFLGGFLMAFGAALGRGCTSGQALTGGALLNAGSWIFMMCFFGGAYGFAWFVRRQWR